MAQRSGRGTARRPATKFAHLQKKMSKSQQGQRNIQSRVTKAKNKPS